MGLDDIPADTLEKLKAQTDGFTTFPVELDYSYWTSGGFSL